MVSLERNMDNIRISLPPRFVTCSVRLSPKQMIFFSVII